MIYNYWRFMRFIVLSLPYSYYRISSCQIMLQWMIGFNRESWESLNPLCFYCLILITGLTLVNAYFKQLIMYVLWSVSLKIDWGPQFHCVFTVLSTFPAWQLTLLNTCFCNLSYTCICIYMWWFVSLKSRKNASLSPISDLWFDSFLFMFKILSGFNIHTYTYVYLWICFCQRII